MILCLLTFAAALIAAAPASANKTERSRPGTSTPTPPKDAIEEQYERLLEADDATQTEVDGWIKEANAFAEKGAGNPRDTLNLRINQRLTEVRKSYETFLQRHPKHARARLAFGSFLNDIGEEEDAVSQWEKARELDPANPAAWNNLANYYGHRSPVKKAFDYYAKAIELQPDEPVYYFNFATTVYMFRKDAMEHFKFNENQVFDKALALYRLSIKYDPTNFVLASDYAQSFYGTKPPRLEDGLAAWEQALKLANDDFEREGIYIHLARLKISLGRYREAQKHLDAVTHASYGTLKTNLLKKLVREETTVRTNAAAIKAPNRRD